MYSKILEGILLSQGIGNGNRVYREARLFDYSILEVKGICPSCEETCTEKSAYGIDSTWESFVFKFFNIDLDSM